jgi:hypothetical protein
MTDSSLNEQLEPALKAAIQQCKRHNEEYHHSTSREQISEWEKLVRETQQDIAPATG